MANMRHNYKLLTVTPAVGATPDYIAGDVVFIPTEIPNFFLDSNSSAQIVSVTCFDKTALKPQFVLYFTSLATTFGTINTTANIADGDADEIQATIPIVTGDWLAGANYTDNCGIACITNPAVDGIGAVVASHNGARSSFGTSIYISAIATDGINFASTSDLVIKIGVKY